MPCVSTVSPAPMPASADQAIKNTLGLLQDETQREAYGTQLINARLIDVMFIQVLRSLSRSDALGLGFLAGIRDKRIAQVLQAVHTRLADPWTVEKMGAVIGLSRSTFQPCLR